MFNESALIKYDKEIISLSRGQPAQVEFNFEKLWNFKRSLGQDFNPDRLSFYHVHPENFLMYSALDVECLQGFNIAFGFPVFFGIITFKNRDPYDINYEEIAFRYNENEMQKIDNYTRYDLRLCLYDVLLLKGSSYAEEVG